MSYPRVKHCIFSEGVRSEVRGLSTILGFYGITPDVNVRVPNFDLPVGPLELVLLGEPVKEEGTFKISIKIIDPEGNPIVSFEEKEIRLKPSEAATLTVLGMPKLRFTKPGQHTFLFIVDGSKHFGTTFNISQAQSSGAS